ncbi:MAG TPA: AAA family ATPase [Micromonosporaceae bacterium]
MNPTSAFALVHVVAGAPGAGKTTYARDRVARTVPAPALLDKDTVYGSFVAATLRAAGRSDGEREGRWYDENIKTHEYGGLFATAREIRSGGCPVVLVAPFTTQIHDPTEWAAMVTALGGEPVALTWVHCDPLTLRSRIVARGSARDAGKLAAFEEFLAAIRLTEPPVLPVGHTYYDIDSGSPQT